VAAREATPSGTAEAGRRGRKKDHRGEIEAAVTQRRKKRGIEEKSLVRRPPLCGHLFLESSG